VLAVRNDEVLLTRDVDVVCVAIGVPGVCVCVYE